MVVVGDLLGRERRLLDRLLQDLESDIEWLRGEQEKLDTPRTHQHDWGEALAYGVVARILEKRVKRCKDKLKEIRAVWDGWGGPPSPYLPHKDNCQNLYEKE